MNEHGRRYFIANTEDMLAFDERYVGYGGDKAEQFYRFMQAGVDLLVSPTLYLVHAEAPSSRKWVGDARSSPDAAGDYWRENNLKICQQAGGTEVCDFNKPLPSGRPIFSPDSVAYSEIYPPIVFDHPEDQYWDGYFGWKLGNREDTCYFNRAVWGNCRPNKTNAGKVAPYAGGQAYVDA